MTRCLWGNNNTELDTSPNAEFYQRCLVWQHPSLPGVSVFPRDGIKAGGGSSVSSTTGPYADPKLSSPLHSAWCEALRSLHQLLRVRQCPYFYVCAPTFTVVYRAAGVCSIQQAHALVTPTTRGLRSAMREEGTFNVSPLIYLLIIPYLVYIYEMINIFSLFNFRHWSVSYLTVIAIARCLWFVIYMYRVFHRRNIFSAWDVHSTK